MSDRDEDLRQAGERAAALASMRLPAHVATATLGLPPAVLERLHDWYQRVPWAVEQELGRPASFGLSLSGRLERVTWHAAAARPAMERWLRLYVRDLPVTAAGLAPLERALAETRPAELGCWLAAWADRFEVGWRVLGELPLDQALDYTQPGGDAERVRLWAERYGIAACRRLGRSLAPGEPAVELLIPIREETPRRAVEVGLLLFRYLELPFPPDPALPLLFENTSPEAYASLALAPGGPARLGLVLARPTARMQIGLLDALGIDNDRALALFEGSLGAPGPAYLECHIEAGGWGAELHYE